MIEHNPNQGRRRYHRYATAITCQLAPVSPPRPLVDIGLNGVRIHVEKRHKIGQIMDVELFFPNHTNLKCMAKIVRCTPLPPHSGGRYAVGLQFLDISTQHFMTLATHVKGGHH